MPVELFATPDQIEIITCPARFIGFFAGRRWGKTDTWFNRATTKLLSSTIEYLYVAPSYSLAKEQYERMVDSLQPFILKNRGQPKPQITFINRSRCSFRSFDKPKFIRGIKSHEVWVDEIQDIDESAFWSVLRPVISDTRGNIVVSGQFRGHNWYFKQFYERGQQPAQGIYKSWRKPSSTGLMFQDAAGQEELRLAKEQLPRAVYEQEYDCIPLANQCAVFRPEDLSVITRGQPKEHPESGKHYIAAYDLGEMIDPSSLIILEYETAHIVHAEKMPLRMKHEIQAKRLADAARRWNNAQVVIDATAGGVGGKMLPDETVRFYRNLIPDLRPLIWQPAFKREMVRTLTLAIEQHKISIPAEFRLLLSELAAYEFQRKGEDYVYSAPKGQHDDQVAALMMAVHAAKCGWVKRGNTNDLGRLLY